MQVLEHHSLPFKLRKYFEKQRMVWFSALYNLQPFTHVQHIMQPNKSSVFHPFPSDISEVPNQADHLGTYTSFHT